jgi:hypothetical protein
MNKQTIEYAIAFLNRTELKGSEVPYFNEIMSELEKEYNKKPVVTSEDQDEEMEDEEQEEDEPEISDKEVKKEKKKVLDLMEEVNQL